MLTLPHFPTLLPQLAPYPYSLNPYPHNLNPNRSVTHEDGSCDVAYDDGEGQGLGQGQG